MPNARIEIPDTESSVLRPVVLSVVRQLCEIAGIPKNIRVMFPGDSPETYQQGSTIGELNTNVDRTNLAFNDQMFIDVTETTNQGNMMLSAYRTDMQPMFVDNKLSVALRSVKISTDVELEIKFRSASKSQAINFKNRLETNLMSYGDINIHDATYNYSIPKWIVDLLTTIHAKREALAGYGQDFSEYLSEHSKSNLTVIANQSGAERALAYTENVIRIQGLYDFEIAPQKGTNEDSASTWITTFTYKFQYDKPVACHIIYPVIIHNQILPRQYIFQDNAPNLDNNRKAYSQTGATSNYFETQNRLTAFGAYEKAIVIPRYDEFKPNIVMDETDTILSALITVDVNNPKEILNLNELGDYTLDRDIYEYMKAIYSVLSIPYKSPYVVSLYENGLLCTDKRLMIDANLNVTTVSDMNPRNMYQLRLGIVKNIFAIDKQSLAVMTNYKEALVKTLLTMKVSMGDLKELYAKLDLVTPMRDILQNTGSTIGEIFSRTTDRKTVQTQYIVAMRKDLINKLRPTPLLERNDANSDL